MTGDPRKNKDDDKKVACQYEWSEETRRELRAISLWTGWSMTDSSAFAIHAMFEAVEQLRKSGICSLSVDEVSKVMSKIINDHPDGIKIVQSMLSNFF